MKLGKEILLKAEIKELVRREVRKQFKKNALSKYPKEKVVIGIIGNVARNEMESFKASFETKVNEYDIKQAIDEKVKAVFPEYLEKKLKEIVVETLKKELRENKTLFEKTRLLDD